MTYQFHNTRPPLVKKKNVLLFLYYTKLHTDTCKISIHYYSQLQCTKWTKMMWSNLYFWVTISACISVLNSLESVQTTAAVVQEKKKKRNNTAIAFAVFLLRYPCSLPKPHWWKKHNCTAELVWSVINVMVWWSVEGQDTGSGVSKMETTAGIWQQSGFICSAADNFQHTPKSSRARIDKRTARATGNTRYRYNEIAPRDHKMADNCVFLARTNTLSSTITKPVKTWKTSNKSYSYNLLNSINKMYTHDLFYLQKEWEAWLAPVYEQIRTTKSHLTQCTTY